MDKDPPPRVSSPGPMDDWLSAGLVCLLHCNPLMEYILSGRAQADINVENPLGSKGEIMTAFVQQSSS